MNTHQSQWFRGMVDGLTVMPLSEFEPHTQPWCGGHQELISILTAMLVERRFMSLKAYSRMSMEATLRAAGFAVPT